MFSILCVSYRNAPDVAGLLDSLAAHHGDEAYEVVVVDHEPGFPFEPGPHAAGCRIIRQPNAGFAAGVNAAARVARGDCLFIANPDLRIQPGVLSRARRMLAADPTIGLLLPRLRYPDGRSQPSVRRFYTWSTALYARFPLRAFWHPGFFRRYLYEGEAFNSPTDVDWGLGGAMFLRRADVSTGDIFDQRFFLYFEDVDLCLRTWRSGRRVVYAPDIECTHAHRRASRMPFGRHGWHHLCSFLKFVMKHGGMPGRTPTD